MHIAYYVYFPAYTHIHMHTLCIYTSTMQCKCAAAAAANDLIIIYFMSTERENLARRVVTSNYDYKLWKNMFTVFIMVNDLRVRANFPMLIRTYCARWPAVASPRDGNVLYFCVCVCVGNHNRL